MEENKKIEIIGRYGAILSLIEVGLGSFLHALHIPFSGEFLSLNQGYILSRAAIELQKFPENLWSTYSISNVASILKSFSPAGKKLGPMLSLSMQGLLFNLGTAVFGVNLPGLAVGMIFLSVWTFIQPLVTYYLFFGEKLFTSIQFLYKKTLPYHGLKAETLGRLLLLLIIVKMFIACVLAFVAWRRRDKTLYAKNYEEELLQLAKEKIGVNSSLINNQNQNRAWMAFKDLFRPLFIISLIMTSLFLYFSNTNHSNIGWYLLRPIGIGFIFFYVSRTLTLDRLLARMEGGPFHSFTLGCQTALSKIRTFI